MTLVCPINANGGAGHDGNPPLTILMDLVNVSLKVFDKVECEGIFFFFFFVMQRRRRCYKWAVPSGLNRGYSFVPTIAVEPRDL